MQQKYPLCKHFTITTLEIIITQQKYLLCEHFIDTTLEKIITQQKYPLCKHFTDTTLEKIITQQKYPLCKHFTNTTLEKIITQQKYPLCKHFTNTTLEKNYNITKISGYYASILLSQIWKYYNTTKISIMQAFYHHNFGNIITQQKDPLCKHFTNTNLEKLYHNKNIHYASILLTLF